LWNAWKTDNPFLESGVPMPRHPERQWLWYVENRLVYLRHQQQQLKLRLEQWSEGEQAEWETDRLDSLRHYVEITGRIRELEKLQEQIDKW